jgi:tetratricopeptide (TPR) repeat protein
VNSKEEVLSLTAETSRHSHILFSPDGDRLLCVNQNLIGEWDARKWDTSEETEQRIASREERRVRWHFAHYLSAVKNKELFATVHHISSIVESEYVKKEKLDMLNTRARAFVELGKYEQAILDFESIPAARRKVSLNTLGIYYLLSGNTDGYYRVCDEMSKDLTSPLKINNATWLCLLIPESIGRYPSLQKAASDSLEGEAADYLNTLGVMYVRTGEFEKGIETLERGVALRGNPHPLDWFFLGLAYKGLGQIEEATDYSSTFNAWIEEQKLKRKLLQPTDPAFTKTLELELKLFLAEDPSFSKDR